METKVLKRTLLIALLVGLIIVVVAIILNAYKSPFNQETTNKPTSIPTQKEMSSEFSYIAGNPYILYTEKLSEGYMILNEKHKNYEYRDINDMDAYYDLIVSETGQVIYKKLYKSVGSVRKYGDELFFWESNNEGDDYFKTLNVKDGKFRVIFEDRYESCFKGPMIYKDKIYYTYCDWEDPSAFDTPDGHISVANLNGEYNEDIKLKNFDIGNDTFLGIAYDRIYYTSESKTCAVIKSCKIDGSDYKVVADGFKMRYNCHMYESKRYMGGITFDETGWYFLGGNKPPYKDLCKVNFETGEAEVIKKNICKRNGNKNEYCFEVYDKYAYYRNNENKYLYRVNMETGKSEIFLKKPILSYLEISGKHLYFSLEDGLYRINIAKQSKSLKYEKVETY